MYNVLKYIVFLLIIFFCLSVSAKQWPKPSFENCKFYDRAEIILNCKNTDFDYLSNFGKYYCEKFLEESKKWKGQLKKWTEETGLCLQEMIYDNRNKRIIPCEQMEDFAFDSHSICYKQYKICNLNYKDKLKILSVLEASHIYARPGKTLIQMMNVVEECFEGIVSSIEKIFYTRTYNGLEDSGVGKKQLAAKIFDHAPVIPDQRKKYFKNALSIIVFDESNDKTDQAISEFFLSRDFSWNDFTNEIDSKDMSCLKGIRMQGSLDACTDDQRKLYNNKDLRLILKNSSENITEEKLRKILNLNLDKGNENNNRGDR